MTAPLILARLLKEAHLRDSDRVLVVAGATGYAAALAAGLVKSVVSLDDDENFAKWAATNFETLGLTNARSVSGALEAGAPGEGPFDAIVVDGVSQGAFGALLNQLAHGGRLVAIVSDRPGARTGKAVHVPARRRAGVAASAVRRLGGCVGSFRQAGGICFLNLLRAGVAPFMLADLWLFGRSLRIIVRVASGIHRKPSAGAGLQVDAMAHVFKSSA